jgi:hypothetical protein
VSHQTKNRAKDRSNWLEALAGASAFPAGDLPSGMALRPFRQLRLGPHHAGHGRNRIGEDQVLLLTNVGRRLDAGGKDQLDHLNSFSVPPMKSALCCRHLDIPSRCLPLATDFSVCWGTLPARDSGNCMRPVIKEITLDQDAME